ncbi:hypothetical protein [Belnapia rosea]|nr:hypothetical protein [Belnapia rosea]SDB20840.1 hypothetical protein SAMN02927895_00823 [Belnapia rosea]
MLRRPTRAVRILAEQMTSGIDEMHEGIAEASDKGKPMLRRILATH